MPSFASDPAGFAEALERRAEEMKARAERAEEAMAAGSFTASNRDKSVTVTVNSTGALTGIEFGVKAKALTQLQLASAVMEVYGQATAEAGRRSREVLAELAGGGSGAMELFESFMPADEPEKKRAW